MTKIYKFSADWCQPCKALSARIKALGVQLPEYNIDDEEVKPLLAKFNIRSVPTIIIENDNGSFISYTGNTVPDNILLQFKVS